jgi:hypothetical protein
MSVLDLPDNPAIVRSVSAPCSAGKTHAVCGHIAEQLGVGDNKRSAKGRTDGTRLGVPIRPALNELNLGRQSHLYVAPSIKLLKEVAAQLEALRLRPRIVTSETYPGQAVRTLVEHIKDLGRHGVVVLTTHESYLRLPYFHRRQDWHVWIDEVPQVDRYHAPRLPRHHRLVAEHLRIERVINEQVALVVPSHPGRLKRFLEQPADDVEEAVLDVLRDALSPFRDLFVSTETWTRVIERQEIAAGDDANQVRFVSLLNAEAFRGATLLGANIERSMLYYWLTRWGVTFVEHEDIVKRLRYRAYPAEIADRVQISYCLDKRAFSKTWRDALAEDGRRNIESIEELVLQELGDERFLLVCNNDYDGRLLSSPNCQRLPTVAHGLNAFQDHTTIVFLAALHRTPQHNRLLKALGIGPDVVQTSTAYEVLHQCVMRTQLRVPGATAPVHIIVPDRFCADFLVQIFGPVQVKKIGEFVFETREPLSPTDRNRRSQFFGWKSEMFTGRRDRGSGRPSTEIVVTYQNDPFAVGEDEFTVDRVELLQFVKELGAAAKAPLDSKDESVMFCLTEFDPTRDPEGYRRQANFVRSYGLVLDFDGGSLSPEEFDRIFWSEAGTTGKRSFIITNSFSRSAANPNRFRVIFPFKVPATSLAEFQAVYDSLVNRLRDHGHTVESMKLDTQCRSGIHPFWVPCTNRAHPEWAFFRKHGLDRARDIERYAIDPSTYLPTAGEEPEPFRCRRPGGSRPRPSEARRSEILVELRYQYGGMRTGRHTSVLSAGNRLAGAGFTETETEGHLHDLFGQDREIAIKIRDVVRKLSLEGRFWWSGDRPEGPVA